MIDCRNQMVDNFSIVLGDKGTIKTLAKKNIFKVEDSEDLDKSKVEQFHIFVAKGLFAFRQACPDIHLVHFIKYCISTCDDKLIISVDNLHVLKWYVDSSFAVHPDFRSQSGGVMVFDKVLFNQCQGSKD